LNKAIVNYTSPALCTPVTPGGANGPFCNGVILLAAIVLQFIVNGAVTPFPAIGDAAYRQCAGEGLSHGHRQHAQKML